MRRKLCIILLLFLASNCYSDDPVPLGSAVYLFLDRLASQGYIPLLAKSLPMSKEEAIRLLNEAHESVKYDVDKKRIERYLKLLSKGPRWDFDLEGGIRREKASILDVNACVWGKLLEGMRFGEEIRWSLISGEVDRLPYAIEHITDLGEGRRSISELNAYITLGLSSIRVKAGRCKVRWGPGIFGAPTLSDNPPPMDLMEIKLPLDPLHFTFLIASLKDETKKYLTAH